jgi:hypothetical protein
MGTPPPQLRSILREEAGAIGMGRRNEIEKDSKGIEPDETRSPVDLGCEIPAKCTSFAQKAKAEDSLADDAVWSELASGRRMVGSLCHAVVYRREFRWRGGL